MRSLFSVGIYVMGSCSMCRGWDTASESTVRFRVSTYTLVHVQLGPSAHYILQYGLEYAHRYSSLYILIFRSLQSWQLRLCSVLPTGTSLSPSSSSSAMVARRQSHGSQRQVMHILETSHSLQK